MLCMYEYYKKCNGKICVPVSYDFAMDTLKNSNLWKSTIFFSVFSLYFFSITNFIFNLLIYNNIMWSL